MQPEINYKFGLNTPECCISANIEYAIRQGLPQLGPHEDQDDPIALVLSGPSLEETYPLLQQKVSGGMKVVSVNGTHDWLLERGIRPSAHIMVDARKWNYRFVKNWQPKTKYLIGSQCHPWVFKTLKGADTYLFHPIGQEKYGSLLETQYGDDCILVKGGSTVALRAIPLLSMLGFKNIEVFGFDSCYQDSEHHAFDQKENDGEYHDEIEVAGRKFIVDISLLSQAEQFQEMVKYMGDQFNLLVHGDGLISHLIKTGAEMREVH